MLFFSASLTRIILLSALAAVPAAEAKSSGGNKNRPGRTADGKPDNYEKIFDSTVKGADPDTYLAHINGGWQKNLSAMRPSLKPEANYLIIHAQEPKDVFDARSANNFKKGLLSKGLSEMSQNTLGIGHVFLSWRCRSGGQMLEGTVGMTGELDDQLRKMLDSGWGLAAFTASFSDGHLQTPALLDFEYGEELPMHTLAIEVDSQVCENTLGFVRSFLAHPDKPMENFGINLLPEKFEGGGCGSFGVTVLEKSGVFGEEKLISSLWRTIYGREKLFGQGLALPEDAHVDEDLRKGEERKVSKAKLFLLSNWDPSSRTKGRAIHLMDPEMLLLFLKTTYRSFLGDISRANGSMGLAFRNSPQYRSRIALKGELRVDSRDRRKWTVIEGERQPIDGSFDPQSARIVAKTRSWAQKLKASGYRASPFAMSSGAGVTNTGVVLHRP